MWWNKKIYFVAFLLLVSFTYSCKKKSTVLVPTIYTPKLAGMHNWKGIIGIHHYNLAVDTIDSVNYAFPITVINDSLIKVGDCPLPLSSFDNTNIIYQVDYSYLPTNRIDNFTITYNYLKNTISYEKLYGYFDGDYQDTLLTSP
jgi:hypothetical protein